MSENPNKQTHLTGTTTSVQSGSVSNGSKTGASISGTV